MPPLSDGRRAAPETRLLRAHLSKGVSHPDATVPSMVGVAWTAIGLLGATLLGSLYSLGSRIDALGARLDGRIGGLGTRIDGLGTRIDGLADRIDTLDARLSSRLDALAGRLDAHLERHAG